jgi:hypothetical protein
MSLPNLEAYLKTLQRPASQTFRDNTLQRCEIERNTLGMPRVRSGNFALVFRMNDPSAKRAYAVRVFTRVSKDVEERYQAIAKAIKVIRETEGSSFFVHFDYQAHGLVVNEQTVPVIKMDWNYGETLGEYLNKHYKDARRIAKLRTQLRELCSFLTKMKMAHGDIQLGNVLVSKDGGQIKLIDYDGVYVPALQGKLASELGQVNFQHPGRKENLFGPELDRFAFMSLDLSLGLLEQNADLWDRTYSDEEGVIFRATDYANPLASQTFGLAAQVPALSLATKQFALMCLGPVEKLPDPFEFFENRIPPGTLVFKPKPKPEGEVVKQEPDKDRVYVGSYEVVAAGQFAKISRYAGKRVEAVGKVVDVRSGKAYFDNNRLLRPYIYVDFTAMSSGNVVRIKLLPEILEGFTGERRLLPNDSWIGKWITVSEMIQPVQYLSHPSFPAGIGEAGIVVNDPFQVKILSAEEAAFRLKGNNNMVRRRLGTRMASVEIPLGSRISGTPGQRRNADALARLSKM